MVKKLGCILYTEIRTKSSTMYQEMQAHTSEYFYMERLEKV